MTGRELVADVLVEELARRGVDTVFGLPGVQLDPLFDALARSDRLRLVHVRHEQSASLMAYGFARATGRPGVCVVVPGPGVLHAGAGLATAWATDTPVLLLAGDIFGGATARGSGALHEIPDQSAVISGTIGDTETVANGGELIGAIERCFRRLDGPPSRPAALQIGPSALAEEFAAHDGAAASGTNATDASAEPDSLDVESAVAALRGSVRPVVLVGGGARRAGREALDLADKLGAPIIVTSSAKGVVDETLERVLPHVASYALLEHADAVVVAGSRFDARCGREVLRPGTRLVRIDIDDERASQAMNDGVSVTSLVADSAVALRELAAAELDAAEPDWLRRACELRRVISERFATELPVTTAFAAAVRAATPIDGIIVDEMTQVGYLARNALPAHDSGIYVTSGFQGTLGYGYPTALGAKIGAPERAVVSISGDGGFGYNLGELASAVHHRIAVVAVVFDDGAFGNVKTIQKQVYGREIGSSLTNPDYVACAASFGMAATVAESPAELEDAIRSAIDADEPTVIAVPLGPQPDIWPLLTGAERFDLPV